VDKSCGKLFAACEKTEKEPKKGPKSGKNPVLGPFSLFNSPSPAHKFFSTEFEYPVEIFHRMVGKWAAFRPSKTKKDENIHKQ